MANIADPGCVKTPKGRVQRGIEFPGPIEFQQSWEHSPRHSRSRRRSFYVLRAPGRFYTAKTLRRRKKVVRRETR
jgi:hypothetical protein